MVSPRRFARRFSACVSALGVVAAGASCGGSDAASGPAVLEDGGLPDGATTDSAPPPPPPPPPPCVGASCPVATGFAARKVYLGETDRSGTTVAQSWKMYGRNIDGITSVQGVDNGECKRIAGAPASTAADGNDGIDNAWGKTVLGFILALQPTPTKSTNALIEAGGRTPMLQFATAPKQAGVAPFAFITAEDTLVPKWDGSDSRPIAESSTTGGKPKTTFAGGTIAGGVLTSGIGSAPFVLSFSFGGAGFNVPIRLSQVTMKLAADGKTATEGIISGVVDTEEMVASIEKVAGFISAQLCSGSTLDTIKQTVRQASDILVDGTQDPTKDCNAISIGVGFDATAVTVGPIAGPVGPPKDPCVP